MTDAGGDARASDAIDALRARPRNLQIARGLGPLLAAAVVFVLMLLLAPSVAPERVVQRPVSTSAATVKAP
jgi:hypothetical protein